MHGTTIEIIHWIWGEPPLADFMREVAAGVKIPPHDDIYDYGDENLASWIGDFVMPEDRSRGILAWERITKDPARAPWSKISGVNSEGRVTALYEKLTEGRKTPYGRLEWLGELEADVIRNALLGHVGDCDTYVHATVKGFHPNNTYRVHDAGTVYERGWTAASGAWGLAESDRQVCPKPTEAKCGCTVVQRER